MARKRLADALSEIERRLDADDLLSAEDREQIKERARKEVRERRKTKATDDLLQAAIREEERAYDPAERREDIIVDLAPYAAYIAINGVFYYHGITYEVPASLARTMDDIMARTWDHQREIDGRWRRSDHLRKPKEIRLGPQDAGAPATALNTRASMRA